MFLLEKDKITTELSNKFVLCTFLLNKNIFIWIWKEENGLLSRAC